MGLASIDAFLDLAEHESDPVVIVRSSLRRLRRGAGAPADPERRERLATLVFVVLAHALIALLLRSAMRPWSPPQGREQPLVVTFVTLPPPVADVRPVALPEPVAHAPARAVAPSHAPAVSRSQAHPVPAPRPTTFTPPLVSVDAAAASVAATRADALHATVVPAMPGNGVTPPAVLYNRNGTLLVPPAPTTAAPRDLLARKNYAYMLPGAPLANSPDFHVTPGPSPQDVVNTTGRILSHMLGVAAARSDGTGIYAQAADRGLRTSGRDSDPCEDIALDIADVDPDDVKLREQAEARYEQSCEDK